MKAIFSILAAAAVALVFTTAFADPIPALETRDIGALLYNETFGAKDVYGAISCVTDFSAPGAPSARIDAEELGTSAYNDATADLNLFAYNDGISVREPEVGDRSMKGSAAGGVCPETMIKDDRNTVIWDHLMGAPGGSDLP